MPVLAGPEIARLGRIMLRENSNNPNVNMTVWIIMISLNGNILTANIAVKSLVTFSKFYVLFHHCKPT